jgi:hypothetical protein
LFLTDVHKGARAQLWASVAPRKSIQNGGFYDESQKEYVHKFLDNEALAKELEKWTNAEFEKKGL